MPSIKPAHPALPGSPVILVKWVADLPTISSKKVFQSHQAGGTDIHQDNGYMLAINPNRCSRLTGWHPARSLHAQNRATLSRPSVWQDAEQI
jgi:hypothetical protein